MFFSQQLINSVLMQVFGKADGFPEKGESADDSALIARIAAGDERAFEILFARYRGLVYSLALQMLADPGLAEDVTLDVFTRIWRQAKAYRSSRAAVKTWLVSIARNRAIDILRSRRSRLDSNPALWADAELEKLPSGDSDPESAVAQFDMRRKVLSALAELPEEQRSVLALAYLSGLTHSQIAEKLQLPLGTVKGRVRIAMRTLQDKLTKKS